MTLIGLRGEGVNKRLLLYAVEHAPTLLIDCANSANPHSLKVPFEKFRKVYILEVELLYKFRDILKQVPLMAESLRVHCIIITTFGGLFHYDNDEENQQVYNHAWELMKKLSSKYHVIVGVNTKNVPVANHYCDSVV